MQLAGQLKGQQKVTCSSKRTKQCLQYMSTYSVVHGVHSFSIGDALSARDFAPFRQTLELRFVIREPDALLGIGGWRGKVN